MEVGHGGKLGLLPVALLVGASSPAFERETRLGRGGLAGPVVHVLAGQKTAGQGIVGDHPDALIATQRQQLMLDFPEQDVIARLHAVETGQPVFIAGPQGLGQHPGLKVRAADIADLALPYHVVERRQSLVDRSVKIRRVHLIEVDVVGLQPAQTLVYGGQDVFAGQAAIIRLGSHGAPALGGQDNLLASALEPFSDNVLGAADR